MVNTMNFAVLCLVFVISALTTVPSLAVDDNFRKHTGVSILDDTFDRTNIDLDFSDSTNRQELQSLWDATLRRHEALQKVVPQFSPAELSRALFKSDNSAAHPSDSDGVGAAGPPFKENERRMMRLIVKESIDRLADSFRAYKTNLPKYWRAHQNVKMIAFPNGTQTPAEKLQSDYIARKSQRDFEEVSDDIRISRTAVKDAAGAEALAQLDEQIKAELTKASQTNR